MNLQRLQLRSLTARVTLFTLVIFLLGFWSLAFYASRILHADMQRVLADQQLSTVSLLVEQINQELTERFSTLEAVAADLEPAVMSDPRTLQQALDRRTRLNNLFNGGVIALDLRGTAIASVPRSSRRIGINYLDHDEIVAALREGKSGLSRPVMGRKLKAPLFGVTVPIHDRQGRIVGALSGVVNLGQPNFLDTITASRYGKSGGYVIVDPKHRLIVSATDKRRVMEALPSPGVSPMIDRLLQGDASAEIIVNPFGEEVLIATQRVPLAGWNLAARLPAKEAFAPIDAMQRRLFLAAMVFTVLAGVLIWWISRQMIRRQLAPMLKTTRMLATLSGPDSLPQNLPVTSQDEIGELIGGFNHLLQILAQRKTLLRQILDTSSVAIFLVDKEGRITLANQHMADMFGCPLDELVGRDYLDLLQPAHRADGMQKMRALLSGQVMTADLERWYLRADGTEFWGHLTGRRFLDASGAEVGLLTVISDITDLKRAEETVRNSEARYRGFLAELPVGIVITQDGRIKYVNRTTLEMIGYSEHELLGQPFLPLIDESDRPRVADLHRRRMAGDAVEKSYPVRMVRKNGEVRQWQGYVNTIDWDGKPSGLGSFIDVTERRQMEEQIRQLAFYDALTQLANRRLLNDRLVQAMASSKRSGCYGALLFLDLDNLKTLNDTHGHEVGDLLLMEAAERLRRSVREVDTVARFGGDEFVVILSELDGDLSVSTKQACGVAEKILATLGEPYRLTVKREGKAQATVENQCSASIGVALFIDHEASPDDLLKWADTAMYQAKQSGKNLVKVYSRKLPGE